MIEISHSLSLKQNSLQVSINKNLVYFENLLQNFNTWDISDGVGNPKFTKQEFSDVVRSEEFQSFPSDAKYLHMCAFVVRKIVQIRGLCAGDVSSYRLCSSMYEAFFKPSARHAIYSDAVKELDNILKNSNKENGGGSSGGSKGDMQDDEEESSSDEEEEESDSSSSSGDDDDEEEDGNTNKKDQKQKQKRQQIFRTVEEIFLNEGLSMDDIEEYPGDDDHDFGDVENDKLFSTRQLVIILMRALCHYSLKKNLRNVIRFQERIDTATKVLEKLLLMELENNNRPGPLFEMYTSEDSKYATNIHQFCKDVVKSAFPNHVNNNIISDRVFSIVSSYLETIEKSRSSYIKCIQEFHTLDFYFKDISNSFYIILVNIINIPENVAIRKYTSEAVKFLFKMNRVLSPSICMRNMEVLWEICTCEEEYVKGISVLKRFYTEVYEKLEIVDTCIEFGNLYTGILAYVRRDGSNYNLYKHVCMKRSYAAELFARRFAELPLKTKWDEQQADLSCCYLNGVMMGPSSSMVAQFFQDSEQYCSEFAEEMNSMQTDEERHSYFRGLMETTFSNFLPSRHGNGNSSSASGCSRKKKKATSLLDD